MDEWQCALLNDIAFNENTMNTNKLYVTGDIEITRSIIKQVGTSMMFWQDYVFMSLNKVEKFVKEDGLLPNVKFVKAVVENGINLDEQVIKHLEKITELTLCTIDQEKKINRLEKRLIEQEEKFESMLKKMQKALEEKN